MSDLFQKIQQDYPLNEASIDVISRAVQKQLKLLKYEKRDVNRIRLVAEDALLSWKQKFGSDATCGFSMDKRFRKPYILLEVEGEAFNPLEKDGEMFGEWGQHLLDELGFQPGFSYANGTNKIRFELKAPKPSSMLLMLIAVLCAVGLGLLGNWMPADMREMLTVQLLGRLSDLFFGLIGAVAGPLVFLSVLTGVCSIGDTATLGTMGKTSVTSFISLTFFPILFCGVTVPFLFGIQFGKTAGASGAASMADMVFDIIPTNMFTPFAEGNCLQIIVLAVACGLALLVIGKKASGLVDIVEQLCAVIRLIMSWVGSAIPFFIFVILLQNIWSGSFGVLLQAWKPFILILLLVFLQTLLLFFFTVLRHRVRPAKLLKAISPAAMVALTTASSMAALTEAMFCCENKFGVQKKFTNFALPISTMLCKPCTGISFTVYVLYSMHSANIQLSVSSVALMVVSITLILVAAPPVPGGILSCYTIIFAQLGIPTSALAAVLTLDIVMDFLNSALNMSIRLFSMLQQSKRLGIRDETILDKLRA